MDEFTCPKCQSEDVRGERRSGGVILLTCQACQASWPRVPKPSCPRCGTGDVEGYGQEAWTYDGDPGEEAGAEPDGSWSHAQVRALRCRKCGNTWGSGS
ncbi:MAG: hypothetical protein ACRDZ7_06980 [Acidimicrobiia bacterium]